MRSQIPCAPVLSLLLRPIMRGAADPVRIGLPGDAVDARTPCW